MNQSKKTKMTKQQKLNYLSKKLKESNLDILLPILKDKAKNNPLYFDEMYEIVADERWRDYSPEEERINLQWIVESDSVGEAAKKNITNSLMVGIRKTIEDHFREQGIEYKQFEHKREQEMKKIEKDSMPNKVSYLMQIAARLNLYKSNPAELYNKIQDIHDFHLEYFNQMIFAVQHLMGRDQEIELLQTKFETLLSSTSIDGALGRLQTIKRQRNEKE